MTWQYRILKVVDGEGPGEDLYTFCEFFKFDGGGTAHTGSIRLWGDSRASLLKTLKWVQLAMKRPIIKISKVEYNRLCQSGENKYESNSSASNKFHNNCTYHRNCEKRTLDIKSNPGNKETQPED